MSKGRMCSQWLMASLALIWSAAGTGAAAAATLYVSKSGNDGNNGQSWATAKLTVQAGLDTAASGDQVWVAAGTYVENIMLKDGVALNGGFAGTESQLDERDWVTNKTILDGNQAGSVVTSPSGATATTRIDGFTIRNGTASNGGGIYCGSSSSPTIANNTIMGNSGHVGGGIYCDSSSPTIANNTITRNRGSYSGGGIYCVNSSPMITNNTITGNSVTAYGGGIYCYSSSPMITNDTITGNHSSSYGGGIYCSSSSPTIANTIIAFNSSGIYKTGSGTPTLQYNCVYGNTAYNYSGITDPTGTDGNISADPKLADVAFGNMHIQSDSPCVDAGGNAYVFGEQDMDGQSRIQPAEGTVDIGADESDGSDWPAGPYTIIRVSPDGDDAHDGSSWALAKRTIQAGVDAAAALGGEVWVRAGTYNERINLHPYAYLNGGFAGTESSRGERDWVTNVSIIDGQQGGSVVSVRGGYQVSRIDGFTIRNGDATYGGGINCYSSSPMIANNTITGNSGNYDGGGIYCDYSSPTIANNTVTGNSGSGISCLYSSPTIADNTITGNSSNYGGGIYCSTSSAPMITNNTIMGNNATYGGGIRCAGSSPTIANNTITGNNATYCGGGIFCSSSSPVIVNNTITANSAFSYGGDLLR